MRTATSWVGIGLLLVGAVAVGAADPPAPTRSAADLITDLGSPDYRKREKAGADLALLGERALPDLKKTLETTADPEVSRRVSVLVNKIERDRLIAPKRVTLSLKDRPVKDVLDEIGRQTGYRVEYGGGPDTKFSFEFNNTPFWEAIDKVATVAGLSVQPDSYGDDDAVRLYSGGGSSPYVGYAGPFRFAAQSISTNKSIQLTNVGGPGNPVRGYEHMYFSFQLQAEPKVVILGTMQPELLSVTDDAGLSLAPPQAPGVSRSNYLQPTYGRMRSASVSVNLSRGDRSSTTIKTLKGRVVVSLLGSVVPDVVIPDPKNVKAAAFAGRSISVQFTSLTEDNGQYLAAVTMTRPGGQQDYSWANTVWQKAELIDDKGVRYRNVGPSGQQNNNGNTVTMTIRFAPMDRQGQPLKLGPPARFVVNEWVPTAHEVDFEFKDVPLP